MIFYVCVRIYSTPNVATKKLLGPRFVVTTSTISESERVIVPDLLLTTTVWLLEFNKPVINGVEAVAFL